MSKHKEQAIGEPNIISPFTGLREMYGYSIAAHHLDQGKRVEQYSEMLKARGLGEFLSQTELLVIDSAVSRLIEDHNKAEEVLATNIAAKEQLFGEEGALPLIREVSDLLTGTDNEPDSALLKNRIDESLKDAFNQVAVSNSALPASLRSHHNIS